MKKHWKPISLVAVVVLLAVAALGVVGTGAWFTDQDVKAGNAVELGVLKPNLEGNPFTVAAGQPGAICGTQEVVYKNNQSTIDVKYRFSSKFVSGNGDLYNLIYVKVFKDSTLVNQGWLKDLNIGPETMAVNGAQTWKFEYAVHSSVGNWGQGASCSFNIVADSTQTINPGWDQ